jgi:hypothetical protein
MRPRRLLRGLMLTLAATVLLPPAVIVLALVALDSDRGRAFARVQIAELLTGSLEGRVEIASVVDLTPDRIALEGLSLGDGDAPLEFDRVVLDLRLAQILPPRLHLELSLDGFRSTMSRSSDGTWEVGGWKSTGEGESPSVPRWIAELDVLARGGELKVTGVGNEVLLFEGLSLDARLWVGLLGGMALELQRLETDLGRESRLSLTGAMDLGEGGTIHGRLLFDPLWVGDLGDAAAPLLPGTRLLGHLSLDGTLDEPRIEGDLRSGDAHLTGDLRWQASGPDAQRRVELTLDARGVDLRALVADGPETWLNGRAELEARSGPGGFGSPSGWVRLEESSAFGFDLAGVGFELEAEDRATSFDLRASTPGEGLSFEARGTIDAGAGYRSSLQGGLRLRSPQGLPAGWDSYLHGSDLRLEVEADLEDPFGALPTAALEVGIGPGRLRGLPIDGGGLRGSLTPGRLELDRLWLRADRSDLVGEGTIRSAGGDRPAEIEAALRGPLSLGLLTDVYGVLRTDAGSGDRSMPRASVRPWRVRGRSTRGSSTAKFRAGSKERVWGHRDSVRVSRSMVSSPRSGSPRNSSVVKSDLRTWRRDGEAMPGPARISRSRWSSVEKARASPSKPRPRLPTRPAWSCPVSISVPWSVTPAA